MNKYSPYAHTKLEFDVLGVAKNWWNTPSVPNFLSVFIGTQILKNLCRICKNAKLGLDFNLNQLYYNQICIQKGAINKNIWWFNQGRV